MTIEHDFDALAQTPEMREYEAVELWRGVGRICIEITCPFCGHVFTGYVWSLAGSGKRCTNPDCGALHSTHFAMRGKK